MTTEHNVSVSVGNHQPAHWRLMVAGLTMAATSYGLARYGYGLFLPWVRAEFDLDTHILGFIASATYVGYIAATILGGFLSARLGPRLPIILGGLCATAGMTIIAATDSLPLFVLGSVIAGLSPGLSYTPLSDAVVLMVPPKKRDRVYAVCNSGTSLGVLISGPVALFASGDWRLAWAAFAVFALLTTLWNGRVVTPAVLSRDKARETTRRLRRPGSGALFGYAFLLGVSSSAYWTFSVDYIHSAPVPVTLLGLELAPADFSLVFWTIVGVAGFSACVAGDVVTRMGLIAALRMGTGLLVASILTLALFPANGPLLLGSAITFGALFPTMAAFLGLWTINVFFDRPSAGFGASFLILSIGQFIGPSLYGLVAEWYSLQVAFYLAAVVGGFMVFAVPRADIRSMTPEMAVAPDAEIQPALEGI